jgi:hypothetical protein
MRNPDGEAEYAIPVLRSGEDSGLIRHFSAILQDRITPVKQKNLGDSGWLPNVMHSSCPKVWAENWALYESDCTLRNSGPGSLQRKIVARAGGVLIAAGSGIGGYSGAP